MSDQEIHPRGPEKFEDCHVCGHQPQYAMTMASRRFDGSECVPRPSHRYVCTHCNEGTHGHDEKGYAGLDWNGKQLREKAKAEERKMGILATNQG